MVAAYFRDRWPDAVLRVFAILCYATPVFFAGCCSSSCSRSGWAGCRSPGARATRTEIAAADARGPDRHLPDRRHPARAIPPWSPTCSRTPSCPAIALGLLTAGIFLRLVRTNVIGTLGCAYVDAARSRGVGEYRLVRKHAYRPALIPIITVIGLQIALLLGGAVLTETTFEWKGLGFQLAQYLEGPRLRRRPGHRRPARRDRGAHQLHRRHHRRAHRPPGEVLMSTAVERTAPRTQLARACRSSTSCGRASACSAACWSPASSSPASSCSPRSSRRCSRRTGSPSCAATDGPFGAQQPPSAEHWLGTTVGGYDVLSRVIWGDADGALRRSSSRCAVDLRRRRCSAWSRATSAAGSTACWSSSATRSTRSRRCCWPSSMAIVISGGQSSCGAASWPRPSRSPSSSSRSTSGSIRAEDGPDQVGGVRRVGAR